MPHPVISVENLSKAYRIGLKEEIPDTLTGALTGWLKAPLRNWRRLRSLNTFRNLEEQVDSCQLTVDSHNPAEVDSCQLTVDSHNPPSLTTDNCQLSTHPPSPQDTVWALRDVSFEVHEGEVVGIIGRNGAGKSTLLKILSRITEPTAGRAVIRGRVGSLLEVGTGFHPELTGRENVYMNGTILGMTKREIDRKFDEIVDFSGVERFLDTPIKRYSSGMQVRLAFAVAAHLDPEILIVDEVLAVGDAEFQKKCLGKMQDVAQSGRTVLFVSHNMAAVQNLCTRALLVQTGKILCDADTQNVLSTYNETTGGHQSSYDLSTCSHRGHHRLSLIQRVVFRDSSLSECTHVRCGDEINIDFHLSYRALGTIVGSPLVSIGFMNTHNVKVCSVATYLSDSHFLAHTMEPILRCRIPSFPLAPSTYHLSIAAGTHDKPLLDQIEGVVTLTVISADYYNNGRDPHSSLGDSLVRSEWGAISHFQPPNTYASFS